MDYLEMDIDLTSVVEAINRLNLSKNKLRAFVGWYRPHVANPVVSELVTLGFQNGGEGVHDLMVWDTVDSVARTWRNFNETRCHEYQVFRIFVSDIDDLTERLKEYVRDEVRSHRWEELQDSLLLRPNEKEKLEQFSVGDISDEESDKFAAELHAALVFRKAKQHNKAKKRIRKQYA